MLVYDSPLNCAILLLLLLFAVPILSYVTAHATTSTTTGRHCISTDARISWSFSLSVHSPSQGTTVPLRMALGHGEDPRRLGWVPPGHAP